MFDTDLFLYKHNITVKHTVQPSENALTALKSIEGFDVEPSELNWVSHDRVDFGKGAVVQFDSTRGYNGSGAYSDTYIYPCGGSGIVAKTALELAVMIAAIQTQYTVFSVTTTTQDWVASSLIQAGWIWRSCASDAEGNISHVLTRE